jgi:hypothetical protein
MSTDQAHDMARLNRRWPLAYRLRHWRTRQELAGACTCGHTGEWASRKDALDALAHHLITEAAVAVRFADAYSAGQQALAAMQERLNRRWPDAR